MSDLIKQRLAENKDTPYMAQHELVFEFIELEKKNELLKEDHGKLLGLVEDICKEIDILKAQIAGLQKSPSDNAAAESPVIEPSASDLVPAPETQEASTDAVDSPKVDSSSQMVD